jgi:DNA gyrase inhibitor GyrI
MDIDVRIVQLEPMRIAAVRAVSKTPEQDAWENLRAWAEPKGLLAEPEKHPIFGFNNPSPTEEGKEYGYELWIRIEPGATSNGIEIKDYPGGLYAVTTCKLFGDPAGAIPQVWQKLLGWVQKSEYKWRQTHELEKFVDPRASEQDLVLDLYLPIER